MIGITVLGSTGSVGVSTLDVVGRHPDRFRVVALTANGSAERLAEQCRCFRPPFAAMADREAARRLSDLLAGMPGRPEILGGVEEDYEQVASLPETHYVMAAIVGAAGLLPTLAAAGAGKRVLLANKEALVMSGQLFIDRVATGAAELLPVDSEHNAIYQCLPTGFDGDLDRLGVVNLLLTASGGPFRETPLADSQGDHTGAGLRASELDHGTKDHGRLGHDDEQGARGDRGDPGCSACGRADPGGHPPPERRPFAGGVSSTGRSWRSSVVPDMRTAITYALTWPERTDSACRRSSGGRVGAAGFRSRRRGALSLSGSRLPGGSGGWSAPAVVNAANEVAVAAFLDRRLRLHRDRPGDRRDARGRAGG